jgi:hypothetical protein
MPLDPSAGFLVGPLGAVIVVPGAIVAALVLRRPRWWIRTLAALIAGTAAS